jgi:hypothetical protein
MLVGYWLVDLRVKGPEVPFYVGIGGKKRPRQHWRRFKHTGHGNEAMHALFLEMEASGVKPEPVVKAQFSNLDEAKAWEVAEIAKWGRKDLGTGVLLNRSDGGDNYGRFLKPHHMETFREKVWGNPEVVERIRATNKRIRGTPEFREKARKLALEQMSHPEARRMLSESSKAQWSSEEGRSKILAGLRAAGKTESSFRNRSAAQKIACNKPERAKRTAEKQAQYLASLTPEQKAERIERIKAGMAASRARKLAEQAGSEGV